MKVKSLTWEKLDHEGYHWMTEDSIPQMLYRIRYAGFDKFTLMFYHGYVNKDKVIFTGTLDKCQSFAQKHFDNYITTHYLAG